MFDAAKFILDPVAFTFKIGAIQKDIYWYGIIIATALLAGILVAMHNTKFRKLHSDIILDLVLIAVPLAIVGARILYVICMWDMYVEDVWYQTLWNIVSVWRGGLAIYGGVIGGVVGLIIFAKWRKVSFLNLADIAAPSLILGQAIGRWGNFVNQEAFGYEITNPSLKFFPLSVFIESTGTYHMATFFYESLWNALVFTALFLYLRKKKDALPGNVALLYLALYGLGRVFIEPMRTDSLYVPGTSLRISQLISAVLIIASVAVLLYRNMNLKKNAQAVRDKMKEREKTADRQITSSLDMRKVDPDLVLVKKEDRHNISVDEKEPEPEREPEPDREPESDGGTEPDEASEPDAEFEPDDSPESNEESKGDVKEDPYDSRKDDATD